MPFRRDIIGGPGSSVTMRMTVRSTSSNSGTAASSETDTALASRRSEWYRAVPSMSFRDLPPPSSFPSPLSDDEDEDDDEEEEEEEGEGEEKEVPTPLLAWAVKIDPDPERACPVRKSRLNTRRVREPIDDVYEELVEGEEAEPPSAPWPPRLNWPDHALIGGVESKECGSVPSKSASIGSNPPPLCLLTEEEAAMVWRRSRRWSAMTAASSPST